MKKRILVCMVALVVVSVVVSCDLFVKEVKIEKVEYTENNVTLKMEEKKSVTLTIEPLVEEALETNFRVINEEVVSVTIIDYKTIELLGLIPGSAVVVMEYDTFTDYLNVTVTKEKYETPVE